MGQPRSDLQALLEDLLGTTNVYFQPPENLAMQYPCIVYKRDDIRGAYADNSPYRLTTRYLVTVIDRDPDNVTVGKISVLPLCRYNRFFTANNLNHDVFTLHF